MKLRFSKISVCIILAVIAGLISSSCGSFKGSSYSASSVNLTGTVTDADVSNATIGVYSMKTGSRLGTGTTDANGGYSVAVDLSSLASDDVLFAVAEGGRVNGQDVEFLKFKSIVGSATDLRAAGADGIVSAAEAPDLTVSNVTTAKVAIVEAVNNLTIDSGQAHAATVVTEIVQTEQEQEQENLGMVIKLAAAIKVVVDDPDNALVGTLNLSQSNDISAYIKSAIDTSTNGVIETNLNAGLETAAADLEDDIMGDAELMQSAVGQAATTVTAASIAGSWYGYHVDTWGDPQFMGGPELVDVAIATSGGSCTSDQVAMTVVSDGSATDTQSVCGALSGNIIKFQLAGGSSGNETIECVGTIDGKVLNGTYTMKVDGASKSGGIFKLGIADSTDYSGTYSMAGAHMVRYVNPAITYGGPAVGTETSMTGQFTIANSLITGTISEVNSTSSEQMTGEVEGPRIKAKIAGTDSTTFIVFLVSESNVTGLYMSFRGVVTDPVRGSEADAGTFKFTSFTKN